MSTDGDVIRRAIARRESLRQQIKSAMENLATVEREIRQHYHPANSSPHCTPERHECIGSNCSLDKAP